MKRWKAIIGVLLVFALGAFSGAIVSHGVCRHKVDALVYGGHGARRAAIVESMSCRLKLDRDQRAKLELIMADTHREIREARRQIQPDIDQILARTEIKVHEILRPDQVDEFNKFIAEKKARDLGYRYVLRSCINTMPPSRFHCVQVSEKSPSTSARGRGMSQDFGLLRETHN